MSRRSAAILLAAALSAASLPASAQDRPAPVAATPENAAAFLGDWTVSADGNYGPATFALTLKTAAGKVAGEISSAQLATTAISDITKSGPSLVLRYAFDYQGNALNAVITLTPADNKIEAYLDFADGAAQMAGTATKKTTK